MVPFGLFEEQKLQNKRREILFSSLEKKKRNKKLTQTQTESFWALFRLN